MADEYSGRDNPLLAWMFPDGSVTPLMPGKRPDWGQARWETNAGLQFDLVAGTAWRARWRSEVLNLRPEFNETDNLSSVLGAVPINRAGVLGSGAWMRVILYANGATDITELGGLTVTYWEAANDQAPRHMVVGEHPLFRVSVPTDVTDTLQEGGRSANIGGMVYRGGSLLAFSPPGEGIRFWQVHLQFDIDQDVATNPNAYGLALQASVY